MNILLCFGTRPEAIKMAPVCFELQRNNINFRICVTAQHREMLDQVLEFFEIKPDYDLDLMRPNQSLNQISSLILSKIDIVFEKEKPDMVLVQGDTTTAVLVALAAFHRGIKVGHVEAGLRTYKKQAPFPEEVNRQIITRIADFHFTPTVKAGAILLNEKIPEEQIFITGNTVVDAIEWAVKKRETGNNTPDVFALKQKLNLSKKIILVTGHRRENFGKGIKNICEALLELATMEDVEIVFPVHLNPNIQDIVKSSLSSQSNIHLIKPVNYSVLIWLLEHAALIISDSGGIQEEAPSFKKPVLVTRETSERMEAVEAGFSILVGTDKVKLIREAKRILYDPPNFKEVPNPFGDGSAAKKIVQVLLAKQ